jgi:phosphoglycerate-specific signal transduction histidine kinase
MTLAVISIFLAALVFVLGFFATQLNSLNGKIDSLPQRLTEEFRAMRAEMAAQTSAIANSITAARQAPQPAPSPSPQPVPPSRTRPPRQ